MAGTTTTTTTNNVLAVFATLDTLAPEGHQQRSSVDHALDAVGAAFDQLLGHLAVLPDVMQLAQLTTFEGQISAHRLVVASRVSGSTGNSRTDRRRARQVMTPGPGSSRTHNRDANRAASLAANPELGQAVAQGVVAPDSIDHLNRAADSTTGHVPGELVNNVGGLTADQAADVVDRFLANRTDAAEVKERYRRQLQARTVRRYRSRGLAGIAIEGPDPLIDAMWSNLNATADSAYRANGGRDTPAEEHKPLDHRRFDAFHASLTGQGPASGRASSRSTVVITVDGDKLFADSHEPVLATQLGSGPIPDELLVNYLDSSPISVLIQGSDGAPLWLGRRKRRASSQQFLALAVRDRGCVMCRASVDRCEAHHLMPWTAPGRGKTDVDQMALLCQRCHGDLHRQNQTLERVRRGFAQQLVWETRPATPYETPKPKPKYRQRE